MTDDEGRECGALLSELKDAYRYLADAIELHQYEADDQRAALRDLLRFREQVRREAFEEAATVLTERIEKSLAAEAWCNSGQVAITEALTRARGAIRALAAGKGEG